MRTKAVRHKHLKLDQRKIDFAKRYFGVDSEQEAIDRALALLMDDERIVRRLRPLRGILKGDERPWTDADDRERVRPVRAGVPRRLPGLPPGRLTPRGPAH